MYNSMYPDAKELEQNNRLRRNLVLGLMLFVVLAVVGVMTAISYFFPDVEPIKICIACAAIIVVMILPVVVWFRPVAGLYIIFAGCLLFPSTASSGIVTMPTSFVPFWWNVSSAGQALLSTSALNAVVFSPAEFLIVITFTFWLIRSIVMREFEWRRGIFFWPIAVYIMMVGVGFLHGMLQRGNLTMALYEVRPQVLFMLVYLMAANIFKDRKQIVVLIWLVIICNGIQGLTGSITYFSKGGTIGEEGYMEHDESLLLNLILFVLLFGGLLKFFRMTWSALLPLPIGLLALAKSEHKGARTALVVANLALCALIALLGNQRRASIAAFIIAAIPMYPILWTILKKQRKKIGITVGIFAALFSVYLALAWNASGALALPARSIRSQFDPSLRDASSDLYRLDEAYDVLYTRDQSPWIGVGYGSPFLQPRPLPAVSTDFVHYIPHNTILWVWMRLGHIGFFLFWMMSAVILIRGIDVIKKVRSPELRMIGMLALVMFLMTLTFGKYDLALVDSRVLTTNGMLLGVLAVLPELAKASKGASGSETDEEANDDGEDESDEPVDPPRQSLTPLSDRSSVPF